MDMNQTLNRLTRAELREIIEEQHERIKILEAELVYRDIDDRLRSRVNFARTQKREEESHGDQANE